MASSGGPTDLKSHPDYKPLVTKRAVVKRKITNTLKQATAEDSAFDFENSALQVETYLAEIRVLDQEINDIICTLSCDDDIPDCCGIELDSQSNYHLEITNQLATLKQAICTTAVTPVPNLPDINLKLPELKCDTFSGEGSDELQFHSFITKFQSVIGYRTNLADATKLNYLKTYLRGYAHKTIQHLQICNENYQIAIDLLNREFLDVNTLVDDLLKKVLALKVKYDKDYTETKVFINDVRCILGDLKTYGFDFINSKPANLLISHIVFSKLAVPFKTELVRRLGHNYPSIDEIYDNYVEVIRTLKLQSTHYHETPKKDFTSFLNKPNAKDYAHYAVNRSSKKEFTPFSVNRSSTIKESSIKYANKYCKFCTSTGHTMLHCNKYATVADRKKRCAELNMCQKCSSLKHRSDKCSSSLDFTCNYCEAKDHISALCNRYSPKPTGNFCINSASESGKTFILPTVTVVVGCGTKTTKVNCLLDSGSQRSYLSKDVLQRLNVKDSSDKTKFLINTFINKAFKQFAETSLIVSMGGREFLLPILINEDVKIAYVIDGLSQAYANISKKFPQCSLPCKSDEVTLEGLIGIDAIQCLADFELVPCLGGAVFKYGNCVSPFGNVENFLSKSQLLQKYSSKDCALVNNVNTPWDNIESREVDSSIVNSVLNPCKSYFDPIGSVISDSCVEDSLDKMFAVESLGITEDVSDYDRDQIAKFTSTIKTINNQFHIELPWNDKLKDVQPNFGICKAVLDRVVESLRNNGLYDCYNEVLEQQLADDILEPVPITKVRVSNSIFIPHRPVVKTHDQVTTKVRIVLNCSLKVGNVPSLNEAAYPGVNLLNNLLELLVKIRSNEYFVMSDIKQAFLMIKLTKESDRDKFTILWRDKQDNLVAYRYKALVFGFVSSPFILHHVIKYHVNSYPKE